MLKKFNTFLIINGAIVILSYLIPSFVFLIYPTILLFSVIQEIMHGLLCLSISKHFFMSFDMQNSQKFIIPLKTVSETLSVMVIILLGYICSKTYLRSKVFLTLICTLFMTTEALYTKNYYSFLVIGIFCIILVWPILNKNNKISQMFLFFFSLQLNIALLFSKNFLVFNNNIAKNNNIQKITGTLHTPWICTIIYTAFLIAILNSGLKAAIKNNKL